VTPQPGEAELHQASSALDTVFRIRDGGREQFEASRDRQLAAAFYWANIESALKQYRRVRGIAQGSSPFTEPIQMRDKILY
jgi:hypothetical protein